MKIGLVIYGSIDSVSGGYLYDRVLASSLRNSGDQVEVVSLPQGSFGVRLAQSAAVRLPHDCDILIEDELCHPSLLFANAGRHPYPIVSIVHNLSSSGRRPGWPSAFKRGVEARYLRSVDGFIFNSPMTMKSVQELTGPSKPWVVAVPGGDRLGGCAEDEIRLRASEGGRLRIVFLANVTQSKGLQILLEALARLSAEGFSLDVVGSLEVEPGFARKMVSIASGLRVPVRFHGVLDNEPLEAVLRRAHVLVVPSYYEGFGIAYLEGMAFGLPAIGTTAGAIPDLISDSKDGFLIRPGDSAALAEYLRHLAAHPNLLAAMGVSARQYFESQPTWAQSADVIRRFLLETLRGQESGNRQSRQ